MLRVYVCVCVCARVCRRARLREEHEAMLQALREQILSVQTTLKEEQVCVCVCVSVCVRTRTGVSLYVGRYPQAPRRRSCLDDVACAVRMCVCVCVCLLQARNMALREREHLLEDKCALLQSTLSQRDTQMDTAARDLTIAHEEARQKQEEVTKVCVCVYVYAVLHP